MDNITYAVSVDVNNPIIPYNVYVASVLDSNVRYLEITLYQNGDIITLSDTATATASLVTDDVLIDDSVECTISNNIITVPLEDLQRHGNLDVQVTVTEDTKVLAIPFPIQVRVTPNIAENAQIDENSLGSYAEVVHEIAEARGTYTTLHDAIATKLDNAVNAVKTMHITDGAVTEEKLSFQTREKLNFVEEKAFKILDGTLSGDRSISPTLLVDSISDQTYNPDGDLILYYIDSEDVRHNIFNFSQVLCSNEAATEMIDTALSGDSYGMNMTLNLDNNVDQGANPDGHLMLYYIDSDWTRHNVFDFTPYLENNVSSAVVNQNGTITFTLDDGTTFTTAGSSVIGNDGFSPSVSTTSEYLRTRVAITDVNGTHNFFVNDGESVKSAIIDANGDLKITIQGKPTGGARPTYPERVYNVGHVVGADGSDYILTAQDKSDIADLVLAELPTTQGVQYGNTGN